jgi:hypothetical protein
MENQELIQLIDVLPVTDEVKQELRTQVESEGVTEALMASIKDYLEQEDQALAAEAQIVAETENEIDKAYQEFEQETAAAQKEAEEVLNQANTELDEIEMEEARSKIE